MSGGPIYLPPVQRGIGQFVDSVFLMALVLLSLLGPLLIGSDSASKAEATASPTWQQLGQNGTMQAQWERLGFDAEQAAPIVRKKFDYTIEPLSLALTVGVIACYFYFVLRVSDRQYREVIVERYGPAGSARSRS